MAKKVQYTTNQPSSTTDYLAADNTWKAMTGGGGGVPYTGATANVDLGEWELKAGQLELDQTPTGTAGVAVMRWNDSDGTVDIGLKGGNVTLQVGQEEVIRVVNKTGSNLLEANYQCVRVRTQAEGGAQGQRLAVKLAQADTKANHTGVLGLVTETINNNQEGFITTFGYVRGVNTTGSLQGETWLDGDVLWLSDTTAGGLTNIEPTVHPVQIAYVVYAHGVNGKIFVRISEGVDELDELHDVTITSVANNDILKYNSSNSRWENSNALSTKQDTITGAATTITSSNLTNYRALVSDGGGKVAVAATTSAEIGYLSGVTSNIQSQLNAKIGNSVSLFSFQLANNIVLSATTWVGVGVTAGSNESTSTVIMPVACTLSDMYTMHYTTTQPASGSQVFTVRKNGVDTALSITISAGSVSTTTPYSNTTNSVSFAVGDKLSIRRVNNATALGGAVNGLSFKLTI